ALFVAMLFVTMGLLSPTVGLSEEGGATKRISVIDVQRVIDESVIGKAARSNGEVEAKKREAELQASRAELLKLRDDLAKQASLLSPSAIEEKRELLRRKERELALAAQDGKEEVLRANGRELGKVVQEIRKVVNEI